MSDKLRRTRMDTRVPGPRHILTSLFAFLVLMLGTFHAVPSATATPGDPLPRISCTGTLAAFSATIYAEALDGPDGLAFDPAGVLHVAQEPAGTISAIGATGTITDVITGLNSPEGIAFSPDGALYAVEDVEGGRLLRRDSQGNLSELVSGLDAPEGVAWHPNGNLYLTESTAQFSGGNPLNLRSHVTQVSPSGEVTRILTRTLTVSLAGIAVGTDGLLYATNEASGTSFINSSVFAVDPVTGDGALWADGLSAPEGIRAGTVTGTLYVVEEDTGDGSGRLLALNNAGSISGSCTGFSYLEDVIVDDAGQLFLSEDGSGMIIRLNPAGSRTFLPVLVHTP